MHERLSERRTVVDVIPRKRYGVRPYEKFGFLVHRIELCPDSVLNG